VVADRPRVRAPVVEAGALGGAQGVVDERGERGVVRPFLLPDRPEVARGAGRGVEGVVLADGEQHLGEGEEVRDLVVPLIADRLGDRLDDRALAAPFEVGALALDRGEGDAVDEEDDIGAAGLRASATLDRELVGDVVDVVGGVLPVDVADRVAAGVAVDRLRQADAEGQEVVQRLACPHQPVVGVLFQAADGSLDGIFGEVVGAALAADAVECAKLLRQHIIEDDVARATAAQGQGLVGAEVAVAEADQELEGGDLRDQRLAEGGGRAHGVTRTFPVRSCCISPPFCCRSRASLRSSRRSSSSAQANTSVIRSCSSRPGISMVELRNSPT